MNENAKKLYVPENDLWGLPQTFKGIQFFPLKINDTKYIEMMYNIFAYPKNYIPDVQILKMSYLKFVMAIVQRNINPDGNEIYEKIIDFLKHITKQDKVEILWKIDGDDATLDNIFLEVVIGEIKFTEEDFDVIRWFVLEQDGVGETYIESFHPELEKKLEEYYQMKREDKTTFMDEVFIFCSLMSKTMKDVEDYTLFQFKNQFGHMMILRDFELYKPLEASGQISFKNGGEIKHYLSPLKKSGRYDSILISRDAFVKDNDIFKL